MRIVNTGDCDSFFKPLIASAHVQAAIMTLKPGQASAERPANEHPGAEQWLYVISGSGRAIVGRKAKAISAGSLLLVEKDRAHQIVNNSHKMLKTINFYAPPAYTARGGVRRLASGRG